MDSKRKIFLKKFFLRFCVCFLILCTIFSVFVFFRRAALKDQTQIIAANIAFRVQQALRYEGEKLIIFEEILLDKKDAILNAMDVSLGKDYKQQFILTARLLRKKQVNQRIQLVGYNGITYSYPENDNTQSPADEKFLNFLSQTKYHPEDIHKIFADFKISNNKMPILVLRNPIYYSSGKAWGFAKIELFLPRFLYHTYLNNLIKQGYYYSFACRAEDKTVKLLSTAPKSAKDKLEQTVQLYNQNLQFSLYPITGWIDMKTVISRLTVIFFLSLFTSYYMAKFSLSITIIKESLANEQRAKEITFQAYKNADQANTAKNSFLSTMSHDIRTPMNAITGFCTLLEMDYDKKEKVLAYTQKIQTSCQHLIALINDVLDMSKIESGNVSLQANGFSLAKLIDEINIFIRPLTEEKEQNFTIRTENIIHENIIGDKLRLNQILLNLLSNAVKYTPKNGNISFFVRELPMAGTQTCKLQFTVKDDGLGMSKEFQRKIFEPFAREIDSRTDKIQGTGLGMAIVKNLTELMGGTIKIESELNNGSTFTLTLEFPIEKKGEELSCLKQYNINSVLIAENDRDTENAVRESLSGHGITLHFAQNAQEAKAFFGSDGTDTDLVLLSAAFDNGNGLELAKHFRTQKPNLPIFLLSTDQINQSEHKAQTAGSITGFIPKPFFFSNLIHALKQTETPKTSIKYGSPLKNLHILAAEDNDINIQLIDSLLTKLGASCKICKNGLLAYEEFEKSQKNEYDVILMDIQMPVMDGLEATKFIRNSQHPRAKTIPIIAMTANAFADDINASLARGMNDHITKPIDIAVLSAAILKAVSSSKK